MPTTQSLADARTSRNAAVAGAAASAIGQTATTITAIMASNNTLAMGRLAIQAHETMQGLLDDMTRASTAEGAIGTQRETQAQIQALTDLINQLQAAQAAAPPPPAELVVQPIVTAPTTTSPTATSGATSSPAKSHTVLYVGLGVLGLAVAGGIGYFALRARPTTSPHRNPWNSSSDALGGADQ
jgi:hypothetical protein